MSLSKRVKISTGVSLLVAWELFYYSRLFAADDPSHLKRALNGLGEFQVWRGFEVMLIELLVAFVIGGGLGFVLGLVTKNSSWLTDATVRFLRIGLWVPFLLFWALPVWPGKEGSRYEPIIWAWIAGVTAVALATCYHYLIVLTPSNSRIDRAVARGLVRKTALLQALFISIISQVWLWDFGWLRYSISPGHVPVTYVGFILSLSFLWIIERAAGPGFEDAATLRVVVLGEQLAANRGRSLIGVICLTILTLLIWQFLSAIPRVQSIISSPVEVLQRAYGLVIRGERIPPIETTIWYHFAISLAELIGGLFLSVTAAVLVTLSLRSANRSRAWFFRILPFTNLVPILLPFLALHWGVVGFWLVVAFVAFVTFFPSAQAMWALRDKSRLCQVLMGVDDALPFAFVGLLFGGVWGTSNGLPFLILAAQTSNRIADGIALSLLAVVLLIAFSSIIRNVLKRCYF